MRCRRVRRDQSTLGLAPSFEKHLLIRYLENVDVVKQSVRGYNEYHWIQWGNHEYVSTALIKNHMLT